MKVLLQHQETGLYLRDVGLTTPNSADAMDFLNSTQAIQFCTANKISGMQIVLRFHEQQHDIVLPMMASRRTAAFRPSRAA